MLYCGTSKVLNTCRSFLEFIVEFFCFNITDQTSAKNIGLFTWLCNATIGCTSKQNFLVTHIIFRMIVKKQAISLLLSVYKVWSSCVVIYFPVQYFSGFLTKMFWNSSSIDIFVDLFWHGFFFSAILATILKLWWMLYVCFVSIWRNMALYRYIF